MTFEIYKARDGWRWRLVARNGRIVADSGEAYANKANCARAVWRLHREARTNWDEWPVIRDD